MNSKMRHWLSRKEKWWLCCSSFWVFPLSLIVLFILKISSFNGNQINYLWATAIVQSGFAGLVCTFALIGERYSKQAVIWNLLGGIVSIPLLITVLSCSSKRFNNSATDELIYFEIVIYIVSTIWGVWYLSNEHSNEEVVVVSDNGEKNCVNRNDSLTSEEEKTHLVDTKLMMLAAMKGDKSYFVDLLRHQGSEILNTQDNLGDTVLITAARFEQVDLLELFAVMGADLEKQNKMGATALFVAAEKGFENCVNSLLQAGANVNAVTTGGRTSLMAAVQGEYVGCAKSLLIHGADANVTNSDGMSARDYAQMSENEQIRNLFSE